jgi:hypothetical protein
LVLVAAFSIPMLGHHRAAEMLRDAALDHDMAKVKKNFERMMRSEAPGPDFKHLLGF